MLTASGSLPLQLETTDKKKAKRMPYSSYFKGKGRKVMSKMKDQYGDKKGKEVFYGTANKQGQTPDDNDADDKSKRKTLGQRIADRGKM